MSQIKRAKSTSNPTKHFLFLRGKPGVGKITVAKLIEKELGWKVFWHHDLKNAVYDIVKDHHTSRLMDELMVLVLKFMMERGDNIIFVRPSLERETVEVVAKVLGGNPDYEVHVVRLEASYDTLADRISGRDDPYRISNKKDLDDFFARKVVADIDGEHIIETDGLKPEDVAKKLLIYINSRIA
jgi:broad-specificity NMP kinase